MRVHYHELSAHLTDIESSASRVELLGFDGYAAREFHSDPLQQLILAARATDRITLESRVLLAFPRSPMLVAYQSWFLQEYSGGRLRLGVGTSVRAQIESRFSSVWPAGGGGIRDYISALRMIWAAWEVGAHPDYQGKFFRCMTKDDEFRPPPIGMPMPSVMLAATGPIMCSVAGEVADGLLLPILNSRRFIEERSIPQMREGAKRAGRDSASLVVTSSAIVFGAKNCRALAEARERARRELAFFLCYSDAYGKVLEVHGWQEKHRFLRRMADGGAPIDDLVKEVSDEMVDTFTVVALADEVGDALKERYDGVLDEIVFSLRPVDLSKDDQDRVLAKAINILHAV
jgi:probable F420-dependent oxidoreductase